MKKIKSLEACVLVLFALSIALSITIPAVTARPTATIRSCNSEGDLTEKFAFGEAVYACGEGYLPDELVTIHVQLRSRPYRSESSLLSVGAQADGSGVLNGGEPILLGTLPVGEYDMWVDRDGDGFRSPIWEPVWYWCANPGFFVIPEYWLGTILGLIGCFAAFGVFRVSKYRRQ